ncbi:LysM peptidoglycan-binding domain-containing protein [Hymenobacter sp.]|uniref:LysM peptidoglycan-binding domain-containing protein n=1 Tax=Hymenobacter sp. TaxID=1898978 RepID=UPI00286ABA5F|nr:LysM peptidoglycan-binding domain-containing protein [Hymenobacter sp.]
MRNPTAILLLSLALGGPVAAQATAPLPRLQVPAAFDVAGLHLVLNDEAQRLVQQKADGLRRHQPSFQARVDRADAAFPLIDRVLKEEGVPLDFHYLVLQESALIGDAESTHQAVGYWQLKRETATGLGLVVNDAVDERKHLTASTRAAARYLVRNNAGLRNWLNALLSYNTGLTGVRPYTLPTDAGATEMAVTGATSPYVLMFLAQKLAFEPACGQNPRPPLRLREFPAVTGRTLEAQAQTLRVEPAALAAHNRWLLAAAVPAGRTYTLLVPVGDATQAAGTVANQRLQSSPQLITMPAVAANAAEVRLNDLRALIALPGETTADLAQRGGQRLGEFLHHNELTAFDVATPGRPYYLESKRDAGAVEYHVVQPGETVFDVAQKYGLRKKAILTKNRLAPTDALATGRVLWLQHTRPREVPVEFRTLPEGVALERAATSSAPAAEALETIVSSREAAIESTKGRTGKRQGAAADEKDGWGEALSTATAAAAPTPPPAPVPPVAPAGEVGRLPAPVALPESTPLADEPTPAETGSEGAESRPVAAPASVPRVVPAPVYPVVPPAPRPAPAAPKMASVPAPVTAEAATHRVEPKETIYSISRLYQMSPGALMAINKLALPANLAVGQVLLLKAPEAPGSAATPAAPVRPGGRTTSSVLYSPKAVVASGSVPAGRAVAQHIVAKGETLYSIAKRYQVTVADLQAWNGKLDGNVRIGEVLRVQANAK